MLFRFLPYTTIGIRNCALNRRSVDLDSLGSLFQFNGESVLHLMRCLMEANRTSCSAGRIVL